MYEKSINHNVKFSIICRIETEISMINDIYDIFIPASIWPKIIYTMIMYSHSPWLFARHLFIFNIGLLQCQFLHATMSILTCDMK